MNNAESLRAVVVLRGAAALAQHPAPETPDALPLGQLLAADDLRGRIGLGLGCDLVCIVDERVVQGKRHFVSSSAVTKHHTGRSRTKTVVSRGRYSGDADLDRPRSYVKNNLDY